MASPNITKWLSDLSSRSTPEKIDRLGKIVHQATTNPPPDEQQQAEDLVACIDALFASSIGIIAVRPLLDTVIKSLTSTNSQIKIQVGSHIADILQSQIASFEAQDGMVRDVLAAGYEAEEDYSNAAKTLQGIQLESTQRQIPIEVKLGVWIRIVRLYLEDDDTVSAETGLNKIKNSNAAAQALQSSPELRLHYQLSQARILDSRRDFLNASAEYYNVSQNGSVAEEDRSEALSASIKTAILAPAGPPRSRTLAKLYKDERSGDTEEFAILENMFLDRLLAPAEVEAFAAKLAPHQLAQTADGSTVLSKAVIEHNLIAASRLYENIFTTGLAGLLGLKDGKDDTAAEKAEDYAARMVEQGRLRAQIDQIAGVIIFESVPGVELQGPTRELRYWDSGVQGLVEDVERCAAAITESFPVRIVSSLEFKADRRTGTGCTANGPLSVAKVTQVVYTVCISATDLCHPNCVQISDMRPSRL